MRGAFWVVDTLLAGGYDGPVHFDFKPARTEDEDGVWSSAKACMTNYLVLREKVRRSGPTRRCRPPWRRRAVPELAVPTLEEGETWAGAASWPLPDVDALAARGLGAEHLDQLALEHLYGIRG